MSAIKELSHTLTYVVLALIAIKDATQRSTATSTLSTCQGDLRSELASWNTAFSRCLACDFPRVMGCATTLTILVTDPQKGYITTGSFDGC